MHGGARAQERGKDVLRNLQPVIWGPGILLGRAHRTLRIVNTPARVVFERKTENPGKIALATKGRDQLEESILALSANGEVDVVRVQGRIRIERGEVAAPHDRDRRVLFTKSPAQGNGGLHLRTRHNRDRQQFCSLMPHQPPQGFPGIGVDVAVYDFVFLSPFHDSRKREDRERKSPASRAGCARVKEDDHDRAQVATRIQKRDGGLCLLQASLPGTERPLPTVPGLVDFPTEMQVNPPILPEPPGAGIQRSGLSLNECHSALQTLDGVRIASGRHGSISCRSGSQGSPHALKDASSVSPRSECDDNATSSESKS